MFSVFLFQIQTNNRILYFHRAEENKVADCFYILHISLPISQAESDVWFLLFLPGVFFKDMPASIQAMLAWILYSG